jgi:selenide,water dikinase
MTRLNDVAARVALEAGATGCTDVTGFGLLGHLGRMAVESRVDVLVDFESVPLLPGAAELAARGIVPGGSHRNLAAGAELLDAGDRDETDRLIIADAQTSGGLVFGVDPARTAAALDRLAESGHVAARIGSVSVGRGRFVLR